MDNAVGSASSSNPALSFPQSSFTFSNLSNKSDTHRKEESEVYHDGKGDIAD